MFYDSWPTVFYCELVGGECRRGWRHLACDRGALAFLLVRLRDAAHVSPSGAGGRTPTRPQSSRPRAAAAIEAQFREAREYPAYSPGEEALERLVDPMAPGRGRPRLASGSGRRAPSFRGAVGQVAVSAAASPAAGAAVPARPERQSFEQPVRVPGFMRHDARRASGRALAFHAPMARTLVVRVREAAISACPARAVSWGMGFRAFAAVGEPQRCGGLNVGAPAR